MSIYTNTGLVKHAEKALALPTKYMWGGILRPIEKQYNTLYNIYGTQAGTGYTPARWDELKRLCNRGYYGVDCVGMIKSYYWSGKADGGTGSPDYGKYFQYPDTNANAMYAKSKMKGKINTMPEVPGLIVYSKTHPHVGIYIGGGKTIESTLGARGDGVVKRDLDSFWEYWFECPYIEYKKQTTDTGNIDSSNLQTVTLGFNAVVRSAASAKAQKLSTLTAGSKCAIIKGSDTVDPVTKYIYVKLAGGLEQWIVKSAIKT